MAIPRWRGLMLHPPPFHQVTLKYNYNIAIY